MKVYNLYVFVFIVVFSTTATAQTKTTSNQNKTASPTQKNNPKTLSNSSDSLKMAVDDFKKSMNTLFGGKRDTVSIFISDIDYDDANLSRLKESLKKLKGVKSVSMKYKSSVAK